MSTCGLRQPPWSSGPAEQLFSLSAEDFLQLPLLHLPSQALHPLPGLRDELRTTHLQSLLQVWRGASMFLKEHHLLFFSKCLVWCLPKKPTWREIRARLEDVVLVLGSKSVSWWSINLGCVFLSSRTCLCLSGSLHGFVLLYGSNQAVFGLHVDSSSSGRFSFLASGLSSSADMNQETPGEDEGDSNQTLLYKDYCKTNIQCTQMQQYKTKGTDRSSAVWRTLRVGLWWASLALSLPSSSSIWAGWGRWDPPVSSGFTRWREGRSNVAGVTTSPVTDELQITWGRWKQQTYCYCNFIIHVFFNHFSGFGYRIHLIKRFTSRCLK